MTNSGGLVAPTTLIGVVAFGLACVLAGCGSDAGAGTGVGDSGRTLADRSGCASCHGPDFGGGLAPSWHDLYGSTVTLKDGSTVVADRPYLFESIADPSSKLVDGYEVMMPSNRLTDAEINDIVDYVVSLGTAAAP